MSTKNQGSADQQAQAQAGEEFLNSYTGQGTTDIGQEALSISYLTILQDLSDVVVAKKFEAGLFFNTGQQVTLGTEVEVICVAFKLVWDEKDKSGKTVDRYEPHQVEFVEQAPPPGQKFAKKINPKTQNEIIETFAYALVVRNHPEFGFLMHTAGLGSMKTYRRWNTMLKQLTLPNGLPAPIFAKSWKLRAESKISKTTGKPYYALSDVEEGEWVDKTLFQTFVLPAREKSTTLLLAAPTVADDTLTPAE